MEKPTIYIYLIGGFTDNIRIYNVKETELGKRFNIVFVVKQNYRSPTKSNNRGLWGTYKLNDIILEKNVPPGVTEATVLPKTIDQIEPNKIYCYSLNKEKSKFFITSILLTDSLMKILQNPLKPFSTYIINLREILKKDKWILVGNRCSYLQTAYNGKDKLERLLLIGETLEKHPEIKNIVVALDDESYLPAFRYIFGDILKNRNMIHLKLQNDHEYEYIEIAKYCTPLTKFIVPTRHSKFRNFIHDHSGFYTLLENFIGIAL